MGAERLGTEADPQPVICLLVEDEPLVATMLEIELADAGFVVAGPFKRAEGALGWLELNAPHVAIIASLLGDGSSNRLAQSLSARAVPFLVHSGASPEQEGFDTLLRQAPWFVKPTPAEELVQAIQTLLALGAASRDTAGR